MGEGANAMLYTWNTRHETALHVAAAAGHADCISCLLRSSLINGANGRVDLAQAVYGEVSASSCIIAHNGRVFREANTLPSGQSLTGSLSLAVTAVALAADCLLSVSGIESGQGMFDMPLLHLVGTPHNGQKLAKHSHVLMSLDSVCKWCAVRCCGKVMQLRHSAHYAGDPLH